MLVSASAFIRVCMLPEDRLIVVSKTASEIFGPNSPCLTVESGI